MLDWIFEISENLDIKKRLNELKHRGLELLDRVNKTSVEDNLTVDAKHKNTELIGEFRKEIDGSIILGGVRILRIQNDRLGKFAEADREHTRDILNKLVLNIDIEAQAVDQENNFRIAIVTACLAVLAVVLAFVSATFDFLSFLFKE